MNILRNSARCRLCNTEIESKHVHDFCACACGAIFVDGGTYYLRRGGHKEYIEDTSIFVDDDGDYTA